MKILFCSRCKTVPLIEIKEDTIVHFKVYCLCSTSDINANELYSSFVLKRKETINSNRCGNHNNSSVCFCLLCKVHFCVQCDDTHKEHQVVHLEDIKICIKIEKKRKELGKLINTVNELFNTIKEDYQKEINTKEHLFLYVKKYLQFTILFDIIKIILNTFITFNNDKISDYPSIMNVINNTHYFIDNNTKYQIPFKLRFQNDIKNYITNLKLFKQQTYIEKLSKIHPMSITHLNLNILTISLLDDSSLLIIDEGGSLYHCKISPFYQQYEKKHETHTQIKAIFNITNGSKLALTTPGTFLILKHTNGQYQHIVKHIHPPIPIVSAIGLWNNFALLLLSIGKACMIDVEKNKIVHVFPISEQITGYASLFRLKDNTIVFFSDKGYVDFYNYQEDNNKYFLQTNYRFMGIWIKDSNSFYESESQKKLYIGCKVSYGINAITVINLVTRSREYTYIDDFFMGVTEQKQLTFTFAENDKGDLIITTPNGFIVYMEQKKYTIINYKYCGLIQKSFTNSTKTKLFCLIQNNNNLHIINI